MYHLSSTDALAAQVELLTRSITQLQANYSAQKPSVASTSTIQVCNVCGIAGHDGECSFLTTEPSLQSVSEVNYAQGQGPFSQNYNSQWRQHPNLPYKTSNPSVSACSSSGSNFKSPQQGYVQQKQQNLTTEAVLEKKVSEQGEMLNSMKAEMHDLKEMLRMMSVKMDNMSIAQPNAHVEARLPAQAEANPRAQCGAITTRSGTVTGPILQAPPTKLYVTPPLRNAYDNANNKQTELVEKNKEHVVSTEKAKDQAELTQARSEPSYQITIS
jgi:hypothetical protein